MFSRYLKYADDGFGRFGISFNSTANSSEVDFYTNNGAQCVSEISEAYENIISTTENPHLTEMIGVELNQGNFIKPCKKYKIWDTEVKNNNMISRLYVDVIRYFMYCTEYRCMNGGLLGNKNNQIAEENIEFVEKGYQISNTFSNGNEGIRLKTTVEKQNGTNIVHIAAFRLHDDPFSTAPRNPHETPIMSLELRVNENQMDKISAKVTAGPNKVLEGQFLSSGEVHSVLSYITEKVMPIYLRRKTFANILYQ